MEPRFLTSVKWLQVACAMAERLASMEPRFLTSVKWYYIKPVEIIKLIKQNTRTSEKRLIVKEPTLKIFLNSLKILQREPPGDFVSAKGSRNSDLFYGHKKTKSEMTARS